MKFEKGIRCWIPDPTLGWVGANVEKVEYDGLTKNYKIELVYDDDNSKKITIETNDLTENNKKIPQMRNLDDTVDDLTTLPHLNEPSVLNSVKLRYQKRIIYTFSGVVLVAINPFESIPHLYSREVVLKYQNKDKSENPPHVFAIADEAFKLMKKNQTSQSIIVSGESGAGKTVSAKYIMRYFANVNNEKNSYETTEIEKQILATNPIMEAFGNAKTIRNDNSSRFGKYLRICFDEKYVICGAEIKTYLLERSRLVLQSEGERNYHIFYQMINGLSDEQKEELSLKDCEDYNYLYKGKTSTVKDVDDKKEFKETCDALRVIGVDDESQFEIFKVLAALLHIGNIKIENSRNDAVLSTDEPNLLLACNMLGLNSHDFSKWIVKKKISTRSDNIASNLKYHEAIVARDSVAKYIYSLLFNWLVSYINADLASSTVNEGFFIGVLDIYGFEHFQHNSFEQFCINYANEKLQQEFTHHVFKLQQDEYVKEGIEWSFITYSDNQPCINLIESGEGILSLLDEQCKLPSGSDEAWAEKMFHSLTKPPHNKVFKKARFGNEKFIVSHYALDVNYEVEGFLEKNRDSVSDVQNLILKSTKNDFFKKIQEESEIKSPPQEIKKGFQNRNRKPTLGHIFKQSLNNLMKTINSTDAHYIRCIKPNEEKKPWQFDNTMVLSQLRACGVLETIRISLVGFPSKYTYEDFLQRFHVLLNSEDLNEYQKTEPNNHEELKKLSSKLLVNLIDDKSSFQMGISKIFFKSGVLGKLEIEKSSKIHDAVVTIQKNFRTYIARKRYLEAKESAIQLQSVLRGLIVRQNMKNMFESAIIIQSLIRGVTARKLFTNIRKSIIDIQSYGRGCIGRNEFNELKLELEAERLEQERLEQERLEQERLAAEKLEVERVNSERLTAEKAEAESQRLILKGKESLESIHVPPVQDSQELCKQPVFTELYPEDDDTDEVHKHVLENLTPHKYTYEDLLGMKPKKAVAFISRLIVKRIHSITNSVESYQIKNKGHYFSDMELTMKIQSNINSDITTLIKLLKRQRYIRPEIVDRNSLQRTVTNRSEYIHYKVLIDEKTTHLERSYKAAYGDMLSYMNVPSIAVDCVSGLLLSNLNLPERAPDAPPHLGDVLFPARLVVSILSDLWAVKPFDQSVMFLVKTTGIINEKLNSIDDPRELITTGAFLLNNANEIRSYVTWFRHSTMINLNVEKRKSKDRDDHLKMLSIINRYCNILCGKMYQLWIESIFKQLEIKITGSVREDKPFSNDKLTNDNTSLIQILDNVYLSMEENCFEKDVQTTIIHALLHYIDVTYFNVIITHGNYLNFNEGKLIKLKLSPVIKWCNSLDIPDGPEMLLNILTLSQLLMLKQLGLINVDDIMNKGTHLNREQVKRILNDADSSEKAVKECNDYTLPYKKTIFDDAFVNSNQVIND